MRTLALDWVRLSREPKFSRPGKLLFGRTHKAFSIAAFHQLVKLEERIVYLHVVVYIATERGGNKTDQ